MILYHPQFDLNLTNCGIDVPLIDTRASLTFSALQKLDPKLDFYPLEKIPVLTRTDLERVHSAEFVADLYEGDLIGRLKQAYERPQAPMGREQAQILRDTVLLQAAGTRHAMELALKDKSQWCFFLGGGMHHAFADQGRGFCLIHDIMIGLESLKAQGLIETAWVVDVDAHKGDGTAVLGQTRPWLQTLSLHMKEGWPFNDLDYVDIPSTLDIGIAFGEEASYGEKLKSALAQLEREMPRPDLVIVVDGADIWEHDELPGSQFIKLTAAQALARDLFIFDFFKQRQIPQAYMIAGGYGQRSHEIYTQFLSEILLR